MAPLTWREVSAPNFSGANDLLRLASQNMNQGFSAADRALEGFQESRQRDESARFMQATMGADSLDQVRQIGKGFNSRYLSSAALNFGAGQPQAAATLASTAAGTEGIGIRNRISEFGLGRDQVNAGREDVLYGAQQEAQPLIARAQTLFGSDPAAARQLLADNADLLGRAGSNVGSILTGFEGQDSDRMRNETARIGLNDLVTSTERKASVDDIRQRLFEGGFSTQVEAQQALADIRGLPGVDAQVYDTLKAEVDASTRWSRPDDPEKMLEQSLGIETPDRQSNTGWYSGNNRGTQLQGLIDKTEGAGAYSTLYGHAQRGGGRFAGVDVSRMTVGQAREFSSRQGRYGAAQQAAGVAAAPMGRYQIINSTLDGLIKEMGLPDDTMFDARTQDAMFNRLVERRISGPRTLEGKRSALRSEWEGFKNVSNAALDAAISAYESGSAAPLGELARGAGQGDTSESVNYAESATADNILANASGRTNTDEFAALDTAATSSANAATDAIATNVLNAARDASLARSAAETNTPPPAEGNEAPDRRTTAAQDQIALAAEAALEEVDPTIALPDPVGTPVNPNIDPVDAALAEAIRTSTGQDIPEVDSEDTRSNQANARRRRTEMIDRDVAKITQDVRQGKGDIPVGSTTGGMAASAWDYFMAPEAEAQANEASRARSREAMSWWNSDASNEFFQQNPDQLQAAGRDPVGFAETMLANAVAPEGSEANPIVLDEVTVEGQAPATSQATPARTPAQPAKSATADQAINMVNSEIASSQMRNTNAPIVAVMNDPASAAKSVDAVVNELGSGIFKDVSPDQLGRAVQHVSDKYRVTPAVAAALLANAPGKGEGVILTADSILNPNGRIDYDRVDSTIDNYFGKLPNGNADTSDMTPGERIFQADQIQKQAQAKYQELVTTWEAIKTQREARLKEVGTQAERDAWTARYKKMEDGIISRISALRDNGLITLQGDGAT